MAVLSDADRQTAARGYIQKAFVDLQVTANLSAADIKAAVDATDTWIDGQQSAYNTALPEPFKTTATLAQKTMLFCYVALRRANLV